MRETKWKRGRGGLQGGLEKLIRRSGVQGRSARSGLRVRGRVFKPRSGRLLRRVTRRSRDLGSTSRRRPASPLLALFCGSRWAKLPPRPRRSARAPPQLRRENQSYRSRGPRLHTKPPTAPRRLSASLLPFREPRERRSTVPRPLPRGTPPTGSLQREVRCRSREHPGPSADGDSHFRRTRAAACGRGARGEYSHWAWPCRAV